MTVWKGPRRSGERPSRRTLQPLRAQGTPWVSKRSERQVDRLKIVARSVALFMRRRPNSCALAAAPVWGTPAGRTGSRGREPPPAATPPRRCGIEDTPARCAPLMIFLILLIALIKPAKSAYSPHRGHSCRALPPPRRNKPRTPAPRADGPLWLSTRCQLTQVLPRSAPPPSAPQQSWTR
jgi:hypothetical protein